MKLMPDFMPIGSSGECVIFLKLYMSKFQQYNPDNILKIDENAHVFCDKLGKVMKNFQRSHGMKITGNWSKYVAKKILEIHGDDLLISRRNGTNIKGHGPFP